MPNPRSSLPAPRLALIGREGDVPAVVRRLSGAPGRLVTLTGPGGVGKTSLALAVGREVEREFAHGAWLVDLATTNDEGELAGHVLGALGVHAAPDHAPMDALRDYLREREVLLVLDNCEHLVDGCARLADDLLTSSAGLRILATSRQPLRVRGEEVLQVGTLAVPAAEVGDPDAIGACASVQLFVQRASAARADFAFSAANAAAIAAICQLVDGNPLALELAATCVTALPPEQIAERLRSSFDLLRGTGPGRPARQQTLRATLEWSHRLLTSSQRALYRRLAAFAGGWTLEAAEAVGAGAEVSSAEVVHLLGALVDRSLVVSEDREGVARYRFLEPVRQHAQGLLAASGESEAVRGRHRAYFLALAEEAEPEIHQGEQARWMRRLDRDFENVRFAIRHAQDRGDAATVLRICGALWWYLWSRGHAREVLTWLEPALDRDDLAPAVRLRGLRAAAMLFGSLGRSHDAQRCASEMLALADAEHDATEAARAATLLAMEYFRAGALDMARTLCERALTDAETTDHAMLRGHARVNLGQVLRQQGDEARADELYTDGLAEFERDDDAWGIAYAANNIAFLAHERGEARRAVDLSARAVRLLDGLGDRFYLVFAVEDLARAVAGAGQPLAAARLFGAAHAVRQASGALIPPGGRADYDARLEALRAALGAARFTGAWAEGETANLGAVVEDALQVLNPAGRTTPVAPGGPGGPLTPREMEVARLLARGFTNRQVAADLGITAGTAGVHVEHILRKLDLHSRHQVADWVLAQDARPP